MCLAVKGDLKADPCLKSQPSLFSGRAASAVLEIILTPLKGNCKATHVPQHRPVQTEELLLPASSRDVVLKAMACSPGNQGGLARQLPFSRASGGLITAGGPPLGRRSSAWREGPASTCANAWGSKLGTRPGLLVIIAKELSRRLIPALA